MGRDGDWMPFVGMMRRLQKRSYPASFDNRPVLLRRLPSILAHKTPRTHARRVNHSWNMLMYGEMDGWIEWICTHEDVALPTFCLGGAGPLVFLLSGSISSSSNGLTAWIIAEGSIGCCACCWVICDMSGLDRVYEWDDCKFEGE